MRRERLYPIVLGMISAIISFIAVVAIITRNFQLNIKWVILLGIIVAAVFLQSVIFQSEGFDSNQTNCARASSDGGSFGRNYGVARNRLSYL